MNLKYNESQIIELYNQGLSDKEISEILGVTETAFACKRRKMGLKAHTKAKREDYIPNEKEIAIIVGTLLGDSTIRYVHEKCKYPNLTFVHSPKQEEYFNYLSEELKNFRASSGRYVDHNKLNKYGYKLVYTGRNMKCLKTIRDRFYPNGKKIIPPFIIRKYFTELSLYYMFMDDGSYDKAGNSYIINTQCFTIEELTEFCNIMEEKFGLSFNIKKDHTLYLKHECNSIMYNILSKNNKCDSMTYKCGKSSLNSVKQGNSLEDNPVLNPQETEENAKRLEVMPNEKDEAISSSTKAGHCSE